jgi:hypothetical protein
MKLQEIFEAVEFNDLASKFYKTLVAVAHLDFDNVAFAMGWDWQPKDGNDILDKLWFNLPWTPQGYQRSVAFILSQPDFRAVSAAWKTKFGVDLEQAFAEGMPK